MTISEEYIKNLIAKKDVKQVRKGNLDGNKLKSMMFNKSLISLTFGVIEKVKVVVALHQAIPYMTVADYVTEHEDTFDFILRIVKDILTKHPKVNGFNFNPVAKTCEFVILDNKPDKTALFKLRFTDNCFKAGESGKLYQIFQYKGRPWFIHKLPNVDTEINFLTLEGNLFDNVSCNCYFSAVEKKCAHKTLVRSYLTSISQKI
ncbi:MAG: hypothetical protein SNJ53_05910 [Thermodesulfovibrionales bacterium]